VILAASVMLFAAFTTAFIVRRGSSNDWLHTPLPPVVWLSTGVLVGSSLAIEAARYCLRRGRRRQFTWLWLTATALGLLFLVGQAHAWRVLQAAGIYVGSNPSSGFFYVLTAAHGVHLLGGVTALVYVSVHAIQLRLGPGKRTAAGAAAGYWHFLDALWLYLLALFVYWG
jgi:cytochrome c oxidase subunit 3